MHFGLDAEQQELATTVRALLAKRADSTAVRAAADSPDGFDRGLWQTLCEQIGAAALAIPEEHGGAGFTLFETGIVLDELGRSLAPSPLLASSIAAEALVALGGAGAAALLPRIAAGEVATLAFADRHDLVLFGDVADIVLVATGDTLALAEGPHATHVPTLDPTLRLASLDDGPLRPLAGDAAAALERARLAALAGSCSLQLGLAQRALDMTVAYTKEREQFGRPIGSFQALKHRMADLLVLVETLRSATWAASYAVARRAPDASQLASVATAYAGEALATIAGETIQLHGGIGITWEHDAHLVFKRAHALRHLFGSPAEHRAAVLNS